ncbi:MAG: YaaA family protein [Erysipelotrichaceae bacterium]|nr:YaaA family protein [Erysipelotrichaceae bacterium]
MKIIISPAKKMINSSDDFLPESTPVFLSKTQQLLEELKTYSRQDLKQVLKCNDQLLALNEERFQTMNLSKNCSCALMSYVGLQYQHMGSHLFSMEELNYLQNHLRILSGFYGILRPLDGIVPYRLEMQAKLKQFDLIQYWGNDLYNELTKDEHLILNLASKEYSQTIKA